MSTDPEKPPYALAAVTSVVVFAIYLATLAPTTAFWDTSEYIAAAKVLGIPHPPGNPLFIIMAHSFGLLPLAASYAVRINLFAAFTSAASAGLWFLVAERWLQGIVTDRAARYAAAFGGVLVGATSWTVWNQSTVNEKVYTVSLLSIALVMWLVVRWGDDEPGTHRDRWLVLIAYVLALTSTNHLMGVLALPALAVYVLWTDWRTVLRPWAIVTFYALLLAVSGEWIALLHGGALGAFLILVTLGVLGYALWKTPRDPLVYLGIAAVVVGISLNYLWLPIRAGQYPAINEGEPVGFLSQSLQDVLNRVQYGKPPISERQATFGAQLANFWQYFSWQFARDWGRLGAAATGLFTVLGLTGLWELWKRDRRAGLAGIALLATLSVGLVYYMNFKYGFSQYPNEPSLPREVRERDYFFVGSFAVYGAFVALGFGALMRRIVEFLRDKGTPQSRWVAATPILALALIPLLGNRITASRAHETIPRDFASDILQSVEPYGILITAGDNDTFPLWYAQEVEGIRRDVIVACLSLLRTDWYTRQLLRRPVYEYDSLRGPAIYRGKTWKKPSGPPVKLSMEQADEVPSVIQLSSPQVFHKEGTDMTVTIQPRSYGDFSGFGREDLFVLYMIRDGFPERPFYFSRTTGGYPEEMGLAPFTVTTGLARKLVPHAPTPDTGIVPALGGGWLDLETTRVLWETVFKAPKSMASRKMWVDRPSIGIPVLYMRTGLDLARALAQAGRADEAARVSAQVEQIARATQLEAVLPSASP